MKKISLILTLFGVFAFCFACNDEWKDELYTQMVSFKAPINTDVTYLYLKYKTDGVVTYNLPVLISGSRTNNRDFNVKIGVDNDTIQNLNTYLYSNRMDLYYHQLAEKHYEFSSDYCHVPAGSDKALFPINFNFSGIDLTEKYVLPVTIESDDSYIMNTYKGRNKALLWVRPFNDYSGSYTSSGLNVFYGTSATGSAMTAVTRTAQVVDENTIFWYAGVTEELSVNRGNYKIYCEFLEPTVDSLIDPDTNLPNGLIKADGELRLYSEGSAELGFEVKSSVEIPSPHYTITETWDPDRPYVIIRNITMWLEYVYKDYTSSPNIQFDYYCKGTMTMPRNINTLVPEDMQANYW